MTTHAAQLTIEVKSFNEDQRILSGIATTPTVDRIGDVVEPLGCIFEPTIPLLLNHDKMKIVGSVRLGTPTAAGVPFEASIPKIIEVGTLRDEVDRAWQAVKYGLLRHVSIGFRAIGDNVQRLASGGLRYLQSEILELSLVPIPAQIDAQILAIKRAGDVAEKVALPAPPKRASGTKLLDEAGNAELKQMRRQLDIEFALKMADPQGKTRDELIGDALLELRRNVSKELDLFGDLLAAQIESAVAAAIEPLDDRIADLENREWEHIPERGSDGLIDRVVSKPIPPH